MSSFLLNLPTWPTAPDAWQAWQQQWGKAFKENSAPVTPAQWPAVANHISQALEPWWGPYPQGDITDDAMTPLLAELAAWASQVAPKQGTGWLMMGQLNPTPGRLETNSQQIGRGYQVAAALQADAFICPELSAMGYPVGDVVVRFPALVEAQLDAVAALAKTTGNTALVVGFAEPVPGISPYARSPFYNAVAICQQGTVHGVVRKRMLPNYNEYSDSRVFRPAPDAFIAPWHHGRGVANTTLWPGTFVGPARYGVAICYDWWHQKPYDDAPPTASPTQCPVGQWLAAYPETDVLINCSASPSRAGKLATRQRLFAGLAKRYGKPLVYVNQSGAIDEHIFDGASSVISASGDWVARSQAFAPALTMVNPTLGLGHVAPHPEDNTLTTPTTGPVFDTHHTDDVARTVDAITCGIKEYFKKSGFSRAVLGLSGGLDSSITAALAVRALGKANVLGVFMPTAITSPQSQTDMAALAAGLGIPTLTLPIGGAVQACVDQQIVAQQHLNEHWGAPSAHSYAADNVQATTRASLLRMIANDYHALPLATSDKSELYMGYATVNGDMSGALAPIGDVVKTKVFAIGHWLNNEAGRAVIPLSVLTKPPGAELAIDPKTGQPVLAEDALMPYPFLDEVIFRVERLHQHPSHMVGNTFAYERDHPEVDAAVKQAWLDEFVSRMAFAAFKWWVAPPVLIIDAEGSLAARDYQHPTVARFSVQ